MKNLPQRRKKRQKARKKGEDRAPTYAETRPGIPAIRTEEGVTPSSPEARRTTHAACAPSLGPAVRCRSPECSRNWSRQPSPPSPRNLLLLTLCPPPLPHLSYGSCSRHLGVSLPSLGCLRPPAPWQISERLASELAEPGARCCYDLFLDFLSLCCSTAVASRPIDGAPACLFLSPSPLSLSELCDADLVLQSAPCVARAELQLFPGEPGGQCQGWSNKAKKSWAYTPLLWPHLSAPLPQTSLLWGIEGLVPAGSRLRRTPLP